MLFISRVRLIGSLGALAALSLASLNAAAAAAPYHPITPTMSDKTIVLTGALQPARFADSDAPFNLGLAVGAVQVLPPGVYITANGQVFPAQSVRKNTALNRFESL